MTDTEIRRDDIVQQMKDRVANGLDPLTGDPDETGMHIRNINGTCYDETGREVTLDERGNWVYA